MSSGYTLYVIPSTGEVDSDLSIDLNREAFEAKDNSVICRNIAEFLVMAVNHPPSRVVLAHGFKRVEWKLS